MKSGYATGFPHAGILADPHLVAQIRLLPPFRWAKGSLSKNVPQKSCRSVAQG
jgi:hypothetical protein